MLGFPVSTEFNKRIPKQKFYENLDVSATLRRVFVDQIRIVYWRNKLAASTLNIAAGEAVTEIEVFEVRLNEPKLDEAVLKQIDKEIPYHLLFILTCDGKAQAWIGYKEAAASGSNAFKRYFLWSHVAARAPVAAAEVARAKRLFNFFFGIAILADIRCSALNQPHARSGIEAAERSAVVAPWGETAHRVAVNLQDVHIGRELIAAAVSAVTCDNIFQAHILCVLGHIKVGH